jgi:Tol biopolymer transport system component
VFIDIASKTWREPMYTHNGAATPDWSPDGRYVCYARRIRPYPDPFDSMGIHVFEPATGVNRPLSSRGVVGGEFPRWSPDGQLIVCTSGAPPALLFVTPGGDTVRTAAQARTGGEYRNIQWVNDVFRGREGVLFFQPPTTDRPLFLGRNEDLPVPWYEHFISLGDAVSPDGRYIVYITPQPRDSVPVLYVRRLLDGTGVSRRQLTEYRR